MQNFKGDALELKMQDVANPLLDLTNASLDDFYANGYHASDFLLMLYDEGRMPFSKRVPRETFVSFITEALDNFTFAGAFEFYLLVLTSIFGEGSEIRFYIDGPGLLEIEVMALVNSEFDFIAREFSDGSYSFFDMIDYDGDTLIFAGISGIDSEYALQLIFSEIIPIGISPSITLIFADISDFGDDDGDLIVDDDDTGIIFVEGS